MRTPSEAVIERPSSTAYSDKGAGDCIITYVLSLNTDRCVSPEPACLIQILLCMV